MVCRTEQVFTKIQSTQKVGENPFSTHHKCFVKYFKSVMNEFFENRIEDVAFIFWTKIASAQCCCSMYNMTVYSELPTPVANPIRKRCRRYSQ